MEKGRPAEKSCSGLGPDSLLRDLGMPGKGKRGMEGKIRKRDRGGSQEKLKVLSVKKQQKQRMHAKTSCRRETEQGINRRQTVRRVSPKEKKKKIK